ARQGEGATPGVAPVLEFGLTQRAAEIEAAVLRRGERRGENQGDEKKQPVQLHAAWTGSSQREFGAAVAAPRHQKRNRRPRLKTSRSSWPKLFMPMLS